MAIEKYMYPSLRIRKNENCVIDYDGPQGQWGRTSLDMFILKRAYDQGCDFEDLIDDCEDRKNAEFGRVRHSSDDAKRLMLERSLAFFGITE